MREKVGRNAAIHERLMLDMTSSRCIGNAATLQALIGTGVECDNGVMERVWSDVAAVAAEYGASPEDVQKALESHEPSLAIIPWNEA